MKFLKYGIIHLKLGDECSCCQVFCWYYCFAEFFSLLFTYKCSYQEKVFLMQEVLMSRKNLSLEKDGYCKKRLHFSRKGRFHTKRTDTRKVCEYSSNFIKLIEVLLMMNSGLYQMSSVSIMNWISLLYIRLENA